MARPRPALLARPNEEPDRSAAFAALLRRWLDVPGEVDRVGRSSERTMSALADILGVPKQKIGKWGSEIQPPWWVVMWLCQDLGFAVLIEPTGVSLVTATPADRAPSGPAGTPP